VHVSANEFQKRIHTARLLQASEHWLFQLIWKIKDVIWQVKQKYFVAEAMAVVVR